MSDPTPQISSSSSVSGGSQGEPGQGVATGGTTGQVLQKTSDVDYATGWATLSASDVGLGNVDNTSDANKPVSTATQTALDLKAPIASPTFTGTFTLPTGLTGVIRADSGVVSTDSDVTDLVAAASDTAAGKVELATTAETATGTDATRAVTPDGLHDMTTLSGAAWFLDEDDMASDSNTKVPSQQSVKAYVDAEVAGGGGGDVSSNTSTSVDSEIALFSSTSGKLIKRATGTGYAKVTSGVLSAVTTSTAAADILAVAYPVGAIYISTLATNPATLMGFGTWVAFGAGKTLVSLDSGDTAFDTVEETGGAKTHTLVASEMPSHTHIAQSFITDTGAGANALLRQAVASGDISFNSAGTTNSAGSDGAHNNLQPYIVVYMFKRTA